MPVSNWFLVSSSATDLQRTNSRRLAAPVLTLLAGLLSLFLAVPSASAAGPTPSVGKVMDDPSGVHSRYWVESDRGDAYGGSAHYSNRKGRFVFAPRLPAGQYRVHLHWSTWESLSTAVRVVVATPSGEKVFSVNQRLNGSRWNLIGEFYLNEKSLVRVHSSWLGWSCADAVWFEPAVAPPPEPIPPAPDPVPPPPPPPEPDPEPLPEPIPPPPEPPPPEPEPEPEPEPPPPPPPVDLPPPAPEGVVARAGQSLIEVDWSDSTAPDLASYSLYRAATGAQFTLLAAGLAQSFYADANVVNGVAYRYFVTAVDAAGNESLASAEVAATSFAPPTPQSLTLAWDAPTRNADGTTLTDLGGFRLYWGTASRRYDFVREVGSATETVIDSVLPGTYYFAVTALDRSGNESGYSAEFATVVR